MARRRRSKSKRIDTMELEIRIPIPDDQSLFYVDLAQCMSLMNRKFIRQQKQFAVSGIHLVSNGTGTVNVHRLKNDWVTINSLEKAYHIWRESQDQVLDNTPSIAAKYRDFKVYMDSFHAAAGGDVNAWPIGYITPTEALVIDPKAVYDWEYSEIQIPNDPLNAGATTGYSLHVLGEDILPGPNQSKAVIAGYADSRSRPQSNDPNVVRQTGWMTEAFDTGDNLEEITDDVMVENDQPPYIITQDTEFEFYPGGSSNYTPLESMGHVAALTTAGNTLTRSPSSGPFICTAGLLMVYSEVSGQTGSNVNYLSINMTAGTEKGLMTRDIVDVN